jgi:hypothetical protein
MAALKIRRPNAFNGYFRSYTVMLDGKPAGKISNDSEIELPVGGGRHELFLKIDWCGSNKETFSVPESGSVSYEVTAVNPFAALYYVVFNRESYLQLRRTSS